MRCPHCQKEIDEISVHLWSEPLPAYVGLLVKITPYESMLDLNLAGSDEYLVNLCIGDDGAIRLSYDYKGDEKFSETIVRSIGYDLMDTIAEIKQLSDH